MNYTIYMVRFTILLSVFCFLNNAFATTNECAEARAKLARQYNKLKSATANVSAHIEFLGSARKCEKNSYIFSKNADAALVPASTAKIVTSIAALEILGPSHTYKTVVFADESPEKGVVNGNLVLWGEGDPYFVSERMWLLARKVARAGIKKVTGGIKVNDSFFGSGNDEMMRWGNDESAYVGVLSATSFNFNRAEVVLTVSPDKKKVTAELGPIPHSYAIVENKVKLVSGRRKNVSIVKLPHRDGKEVFRVVGQVGRQQKSVTVYKAVEDPAAHFAHVFASMLRSQGIEVASDYLGKETQNPGVEIAELESLPLFDLVRLMNTYSNNFMAEQIYRAIGAKKFGAPTNEQKSRMALNNYLNKISFCKENNYLTNGSGLSWTSQLTARCLVRILQKSYAEFRGFADLLGSFPIGMRTGTLKNRFKFEDEIDPLKIRAKTGTLWSQKAVTAMAGFLSTRSGHVLVYAILNNDRRAGYQQAMKLRRWEDSTLAMLQRFEF